MLNMKMNNLQTNFLQYLTGMDQQLLASIWLKLYLTLYLIIHNMKLISKVRLKIVSIKRINIY